MTKHSLAELAIAGVIACIAATGCAPSAVVTTAPRDVRPVAPGAVAGPFVQAGTDFILETDDELVAGMTPVGQPFTAKVAHDMRSPDGSVVVPAGSVLRGRVVRSDRGTIPLLALELDKVTTPWGDADVAAKLKGVQRPKVDGKYVKHDPYGAPKTYLPERGPAGFQAAIRPPTDFAPTFDYYDENTAETFLPAGTRVRAELTRPLVPGR
jgi:hypothetical protein